MRVRSEPQRAWPSGICRRRLWGEIRRSFGSRLRSPSCDSTASVRRWCGCSLLTHLSACFPSAEEHFPRQAHTLQHCWHAPLCSVQGLRSAPPGRAASFNAAVELTREGSLSLSFVQHLAVRRRVKNIFEDDEVRMTGSNVRFPWAQPAPTPACAPGSLSSLRAPIAGCWNHELLGRWLPVPRSPRRQRGEDIIRSCRKLAGADTKRLVFAMHCRFHTLLRQSRPLAFSFDTPMKMNKNLLLKGKTGTSGNEAALVVKSWWNVR